MVQVTRPPMWWCLAGVVVLLVIHGCGGPVRYSRQVQEEAHRYIRLEARYGYGQQYGYDSAAMSFAHPVSLGEADWAKLLRAIHVQPRKGLLTIGMEPGGPTEAFLEDDRRYLTRYLAEAFSKARADEWVVFYLSHPREHRGGPGVVELTSGGFFVEGAQLHLVLANYRYAASLQSIREQTRDDPLRPAGEAFYDLVPGQYQSVLPVKIWDMTKPVRAQSVELILDYRTLLGSSEESILKGAERIPLDERLRMLERLYKEGLITEEEYWLKRQKLLDQL
ncbi:MAG TPA: SHOCT domain-containing protein [Nitrospiraceae bacterium]|nr:SHOCT domain-containing protein [Nitrospiraceae bacterium]